MKFSLILGLYLFASTCSWLEAAEISCVPLKWEFAKTQFLRGNTQIDYRIKSNGKYWKLFPYQHSVSGLLECADCGTQIVATGHTSLTSNIAEKTERKYEYVPKTARERVERRYETFSYPIDIVVGENLIPLSTKENIRIGPLTGYAVLYKINELWIKYHYETSKIKSLNLMIVSVFDDCAHFEITITLLDGKNDWSILDKLLQDISIERTSIPYKNKSKEEFERLNKADSALGKLMGIK